MKKIIEEVVAENINIRTKIIELAKGNKTWIFISNELVERLKKSSYNYHEYAREDGFIFYEKEDSEGLFVDLDSPWNRVSSVPKEGVYLRSDPEIIYFLS